MTSPAGFAVPIPADHRIIQRMIMPDDASPDIVPLYVENTVVRPAEKTQGATGRKATGLAGEVQKLQQMQGHTAASFDAASSWGRHWVQIPDGEMRSFGTYFNAFAASYWRRWTKVRSVRLSIRLEGSGHIIVNRSNARGNIQQLRSARVGEDSNISFDLSLEAFGDGGYIWFDAFAGEGGLTIASAAFSAQAHLARIHGRYSLAMATVNKEDYAFNTIASVARSEAMRERLHTLYVVDQGSSRLSDAPERLEALRAELGDQLTYIQQGNIGGSGGFSRGMFEAVNAGEADYVITCDDDLELEPESVVRLVTFADYCVKPTLVGAHMFDINARSILHAFGETVDMWSTQPSMPHGDMELRHNLAALPLRATPWMHRRVDVDYNGWWMCLIPTEVIREIGLSLPVFIKWDDAEYGLRARAAGYPTVSLPGAGVWHMAWADKDDANDWQAYFHHRNRVITALLHSPFKRGGGTLTNSQLVDLKHVLSMQYSTEAVRKLAHDDLLRGPETLHAEIGSKLPQVRALMAQHEDSELRENIDDFPEIRVTRPPNKGRPIKYPHRLKLPLVAAKTVMTQLFVTPTETSREHPQTALGFHDAKWWSLSKFDSALVSNAGGTKVSWYKRDPKKAREALGSAVAANATIAVQWADLCARYRAAARDLTSMDAWAETFANNPAPEREHSSQGSLS